MDLEHKIIFPKILIIGETFNSFSGTGITLSNLFRDYPKDKLGILSDFNLTSNDTAFCYQSHQTSNYYQYFLDKLLLSPLKRIKSYLTKGRANSQTQINNEENFQSKPVCKICRFAKRLTKFFFNLVGITPIIYTIKIDGQVDKWINLYKPDLIYTFLNNYRHFKLVMYLHAKYNLKIIVHLMDDHLESMAPKGLLYFYWRRKQAVKYRYFIDNAILRMSISKQMSDYFFKKYSRQFYPIMNALDMNHWTIHSKSNWDAGDIFKIAYVGRYGDDNAELLHLLSDVVEELNVEGFEMQLDIRLSKSSHTSYADAFSRNKHTVIGLPIDYERLPQYLPTMDLLYLPLGFSKQTLNAYQYSLSTKIPEYLISGTPVLVHAPAESAYAKYALEEGWGAVVTTNTFNALKRTLMEITTNENLRMQYGQRGKAIALKYHDARIIRHVLYDKIYSSVKNLL